MFVQLILHLYSLSKLIFFFLTLILSCIHDESSTFCRNGGELLVQLHALAETEARLIHHEDELKNVELKVTLPCKFSIHFFVHCEIQ